MRFKLTIFLIVANILTFGLVWKNSGGNAETEISAQSIFSADISEITVRTAENTVAFSIEKRDREWFLTQPFSWRAAPFAVNQLLAELRFLDVGIGFSSEEAAAAGNSLGNYGLEKNTATISVKDSAGTHEIRLGKTTPDGRSVYVLSPDGKTIIPAPISLLAAVSQKTDDFRVREVFSMRPYEVRAITVRTAFSGGSEQRVGLVRNRVDGGNGASSTWRFETPVSAAADTALTEKWLGELSALSYVRFVSGDAVPDDATGLKTPELRFTLDAATRSCTLLVGATDSSDASGKTRFAKLDDNPAIFTVSAEVVDSWKNAARDLRDPYFLNFDPATLTAIRIHDGKNALTLHRLNVSKAEKTATGTPVESAPTVLAPRPEIFAEQSKAAANPLYNAWQMPVAPGSGVTRATSADPAAVAALVEGLRNLRATRSAGADDANFSASKRRLCEAFVADIATPEDIAQMKFNTPLRIVELEFSDGGNAQKTQTLTIAPAVEDGTPLHAKTGTAIYSITSGILETLETSPAFFRDRIVSTLPAGGKVIALKLSELDDSGKETLLLDEKCPDDAQNWAEFLEKKSEPFSQALAKLLRSTETVVAESFLPDSFSLSFVDTKYLGMGVPEKWRYKIDVIVRLADGEKSTPSKTETNTYYLTRRLGGTTQLAGSPAQNCIFKIRQDFIDAMHTLTFNRSGIIPEIDVPAAAPTGELIPATVVPEK